jgi:lipopolysaccharide biosynthesis glycosyltransferase
MTDSYRDAPTIVFSGDHHYAIGMAAAMRSVLATLTGQSHVTIYILHPGLDGTTKARLRSVANTTSVNVSLSFIPVDEQEHLSAFDLHIMDGWTHTIFYRPLIDRLIPQHHQRVLYLDCDVIVEQDVSSLLTTDLDGNIIGAVKERAVSCPASGLSRWKELDLAPDAPYFNSGVLLIDMERWRKEQVGRRVLEYLHEYGPQLNIKGNQGGFNAVLAGRWKPLPAKWNVLNWYLDEALYQRFGYDGVPPRDELEQIRSAPGIIHYTQDRKPWQVGCDHPHRNRFFHHFRKSGWFSTPEYALWRSNLHVQESMRFLKDVTRPLRHKFGLKRSGVAT